VSQNGQAIIEILSKMYPDAGCELNYNSAFELLVAVILSAQCTDKRVNVVTKELFKVADTSQKMAIIDIGELEKLIYSCGFYKNKAANIKAAAIEIVKRFDGEVPSSLEQLTSLRGVGRKTANVVLSEVFGVDVIAVDTHVFRVSRRLGLSKKNTPLLVEKDLIEIFGQPMLLADAGTLSNLHHLLIFHGRYCCHSQKPNCDKCNLMEYCTYVHR